MALAVGGVGDVIAIPTKLGFALALCTHTHEQYGALLRVADGTFDQGPPARLTQVFDAPVRFSCFFPLRHAIARGIVSVAGRIDVPKTLQAFPVFRAGFIDPASRKVEQWWLWDGEKEWKVGALTEEQNHLPVRGIWNDTILLERIEGGWSP
jgi:hypothetical protein